MQHDEQQHHQNTSSSDNDESSSSFISSIDGSIRESTSGYRGPGPNFITSRNDITNNVNVSRIDYSRTNPTRSEVLQLESCNKISELLNSLGYSSFAIEPADVHEYKSFPHGERYRDIEMKILKALNDEE